VNRDRRLDALEAALPRDTEDDAGLCPACIGPRWYRVMIDRAWARRRGEHVVEAAERCRRCGALTYVGALAAEHQRAQERLRDAGYP
jgi:hypothetical protein